MSTEDRTETILQAIIAEKLAYARWQGDYKYTDDAPPHYLSEAIAALSSAFADGEVPRQLARLVPCVDQLSFAFLDWRRRGDGESLHRLWSCREKYEKERDRRPPAPLPSVAELDKQKVGIAQIATIWKLTDAQGHPDISAVARELALPGSVITEQYRAWVEDQRMGRPPAASQVDRVSAPAPRPEVCKAMPSVEDLIRQRVSRAQIIEMKHREWPAAPLHQIEAAVDLLAASLGIAMPGSALAGMAEVGESQIKARLGMAADESLSDPSAAVTTGADPTLSLLADQLAEAAPSVQIDLPERCLELFRGGMSYEAIAHELGGELGNTSLAKRARKVERLCNQAVAGADESEEVDEILTDH